MKLDEINRWLTLLANIGVIAGIVFLALELRQNQSMLMAQTRNEISRTSIELQQANRDPSQVTAFMRSVRGEPLSDEEQYLVNRWSAVFLEFWENVDYQYRQGLFEEEDYRAHLSRVRAILLGNGGAIGEYFCARQDRYTPSFVSTVNSLLEKSCAGSSTLGR